MKVQLVKSLKEQPWGKKGQKIALSNKDLPDSVHNKGHWHKCFIPTFLWWVRRQPDLWNLPDDDVIDISQQIWDVLYRNIPYQVQQKDAIFAVASLIYFCMSGYLQMPQAVQHISELWCATFGSMAITIVNNVFESSTKDFSEDEACIHFAQKQLNTFQFLYGDITARVCRTFILATDN